MDKRQEAFAVGGWQSDGSNRSRSVDRQKSADFIAILWRELLFDRFGITRVGDITGFDVIGVPVFHATRPTALVLAQNSGKGFSKKDARIGAIAEGIEYSVFEDPLGTFWVDMFDSISPDLLPLAKGSKWTPKTPIALEYAYRLSGERCVFPSDLLWMVHRKAKLMHFQMTSNGQALGASVDSAFLGGLYECIERDAMTIALYRWKNYGIAPDKVDLSYASDVVLALHDRISWAGLKLYLFKTTSDIGIPVYCAYIVDPNGDFFTTTGWGCDLFEANAAQAAILEAIQSRCVYIAGARDDLLQKDYDNAKAHNTKEQMQYMDSLPFKGFLNASAPELPLWYEIEKVVEHLSGWDIYYNLIGLGNELKAVKVVVPGLEPPMHELWQPSQRCISLVPACTA
jgi:YcaO-like protein with predicted kinase domain